MPTICYLVTSRNDMFCPEKACAFELSEAAALAEKERLDELYEPAVHHVVKCVIMDEREFYDLCPEWTPKPETEE